MENGSDRNYADNDDRNDTDGANVQTYTPAPPPDDENLGSPPISPPPPPPPRKRGVMEHGHEKLEEQLDFMSLPLYDSSWDIIASGQNGLFRYCQRLKQVFLWL